MGTWRIAQRNAGKRRPAPGGRARRVSSGIAGAPYNEPPAGATGRAASCAGRDGGLAATADRLPSWAPRTPGDFDGGRPMSMLDVRGVILHFRGVAALSDVSFAVEPGTIHAVIGPNGAGKTSLLNCVSGVYRPQRGTILLDGRDISRLPPAARTKLGIA